MMLTSFFVFKQKTAYEMRISDWSSDVCSSDLQPLAQEGAQLVGAHRPARFHAITGSGNLPEPRIGQCDDAGFEHRGMRLDRLHHIVGDDLEPAANDRIVRAAENPQEMVFVHTREVGRPYPVRSEEHTSEIQSLM